MLTSPDDTRTQKPAPGAQTPDEEAVPLSVLVRGLAGLPGPMVSVEAVVDHFGARAIGALMFIFALPNLLPLPPGSSTLLGFPLLLFAPQLAVGSQTAWLPQRLMARTFKASWLASLGGKTAPWIERMEALSTRRLSLVFGPVGTALIGIVCTLLAFVLILPIPLGNLLPAASIAVFGLSLVQRDGVLALVGYALAAMSAGALVLAAQLIVMMLIRAEHWFQAMAGV